MKIIRLLAVAALLSLRRFARLRAGAKRRSVLNLFCWSEYVPQEVIDGFTKETGIKVNVENYDSNEAMLSKLLRRRQQVRSDPALGVHHRSLIKAGKLEELNLANIPNIKNLDPKFTEVPHDPEGKYSVPWMAGTVGIVVNTAKVKEPVKGYKDVFSGKYKKRIVVLNDAREIVSWAMARSVFRSTKSIRRLWRKLSRARRNGCRR